MLCKTATRGSQKAGLLNTKKTKPITNAATHARIAWQHLANFGRGSFWGVPVMSNSSTKASGWGLHFCCRKWR
jgi:hypothetical protein